MIIYKIYPWYAIICPDSQKKKIKNQNLNI